MHCHPATESHPFKAIKSTDRQQIDSKLLYTLRSTTFYALYPKLLRLRVSKFNVKTWFSVYYLLSLANTNLAKPNFEDQFFDVASPSLKYIKQICPTPCRSLKCATTDTYQSIVIPCLKRGAVPKPTPTPTPTPALTYTHTHAHAQARAHPCLP